MKHPIAITRNGIAVYVDLVRSQAAASIAKQPRLLDLVKSVVQQTNARGAEMQLEHDMGHTLGYNFVVETSEKDAILYAQLLHDKTYTRFVKNGKPLSTSHLSVILRKDDKGEYELHDAWIGRLCPPRPGADDENAQSKSYWATHAFVLDTQAVQTRTVTKVCPY